jgi:hypothetical protein
VITAPRFARTFRQRPCWSSSSAFAGQDAATRDILLGILADAPVNRQMAVAEYIGDPLLIGALVTLLQTRLRKKSSPMA